MRSRKRCYSQAVVTPADCQPGPSGVDIKITEPRITGFLADIHRQTVVTKKGHLFLASLLLTMAIPLAFSHGSSLNAQNSSPLFSVKISIDQVSLKTNSFKETGVFYVTSTIKNISDVDQNIMITNVQNRFVLYWRSDNPEISPAVEARKPYASLMTLKPGQEYHLRIELVAHSHHAKGAIFRLGYVPDAESPVSIQNGIKSSKDIIWSNTVTLSPMEREDASIR